MFNSIKTWHNSIKKKYCKILKEENKEKIICFLHITFSKIQLQVSQVGLSSNVTQNTLLYKLINNTLFRFIHLEVIYAKALQGFISQSAARARSLSLSLFISIKGIWFHNQKVLICLGLETGSLYSLQISKTPSFNTLSMLNIHIKCKVCNIPNTLHYYFRRLYITWESKF